MLNRSRFKRSHDFRLLIPFLLCAPAFATDPVNYVGRPVRVYEHGVEPAMQMPTGVAVAADASVLVADGVNHRILRFAPDGTLTGEIQQVDGQRLVDPLNMRFDTTGRLWIADTGNRRILVQTPDGDVERIIAIDPPSGGREFNPTDVVPVEDGRQAWIVDNNSHRLIRWEVDAAPAEFIRLGRQGAALGQFYHPFLAALDEAERLFIVDTLNGRLQLIDPEGRATRIIGSYGVEPGQFYRPKGVAVDGDGNIWVSDSITGVLQVFDPAGPFLGVLQDAGGQPMKFAAPVGIDFGPQGHLYVVELTADHIREIEITTTPRPRELPRPGRAAVVPGAGQSPACTICHVEWLPAFADGRETPIMSLPEHGPDNPVVSQDEMCLSCHDGAVDDSRRRVWREHGHQTGVVPPADMQVPAYLPLVDGRVACRTCHSAHAGDRQEQTLKEVFFVRAERGRGELCISCHGDKVLGPQAGAHPIGGMPWPVPEQLIAEGAEVGPNPRELTCYVCHMPHGSHEEHLLVMGTESSQLCLTCHTQLRPGLWRPDAQVEHPQNPPLQTDAQRQAIMAMGTQVGPGDTLICLSCHSVHDGVSDRYLLADTLRESQLCIRCHPQRAEMTNTAHDLRVSAPECRNRIGQTAEQSGPCGACHTFHRFARMPDPRPNDPSGMCTTCHAAESCATRVDVQAPGHPHIAEPDRLPDDVSLHVFPGPEGPAQTIACLTCHDPHQVETSGFLVKPQDQLCAECHTDQTTALAGAHEFAGMDIRNAAGQTPAEAGRCGFCHTMHEAKGPVLWGATEDPPGEPNALCTNCHRDGGLAGRLPQTLLRHPTGERATEAASMTQELPMFDLQGHHSADGTMACGTCHDPHGDSQTMPSLLRRGPTSDLCSECHTDYARLAGGLHDMMVHPAEWPETSQESADQCMACHRGHSNDPQWGLWAVMPAPEYAMSDGICLSCHEHVEWGGHGTAPAQPEPATQPAEEDIEHMVHGLPLVPTGPGKRSGAIGCKTCHDPHAPPDAEPHLLRAAATHDPGAMCLACHQELQYIGLSLHNREMMQQFAEQTDAKPERMLQCGPCHSVHTPDLATQPLPGRFAHLPQDVQRCVSCHRPGGGATPVRIVEHFGPLQNVTEPHTPGFMPLVNDQGQIGRSGRIACITCHPPHGRPPGPAFPAVDPKQITSEKLRAMMPMITEYSPPNLCSSCHGFDGLIRFLYWHRPERRAMERP